MAATTFLDFAAAAGLRSCQSISAARHIREKTERDPGKYTPVRDDEDAALLPTTKKLQGLFQSQDVLGYLQCHCPSCDSAKPDGWDEQDDHRLADRICAEASEMLRRSFVIFALADCLFAFRLFRSRNSTGEHPVEGFLTWLLSDAARDHRRTIFKSFTANSPQDFEPIAIAFAEHVRTKYWVVTIPTFYISNVMFNCAQQNLPFIVRKGLDTDGQGRKDYSEIEVDPDYCESPELQGRRLFLKRVKVAIGVDNEDDKFRRAMSEVRIQLQIKERFRTTSRNVESWGFAELLFAFETTDISYRYVNMVFFFFNKTLLHVLSETHLLPPFRLTNMSQEAVANVPQHPLWLSAMRLVKFVANIHDPPGPHSGGERPLGAHLDIKPSNIVIDDARMLLIDFEYAYLGTIPGDQSTDFVGRAGTQHYQPPEADKTPEVTTLKRTYDVWSLSCVLLEILVCILHSLDQGESVLEFRNKRKEESTEHQDESFWRTEGGLQCLKPSVQRQLGQLKNLGPLTAQIAEQIERMLAINEASRPVLRDCLNGLAVPYNFDMEVFVPSGYKAVMPVRMARMTSKFTTEKLLKKHILQPFKCKLQLWRSDNLSTKSTLILALQASEGFHKNNIPSKALESVASFAPVSLFDKRPVTPDLAAASSLFECRFRHLHDDTSFFFASATDLECLQVLMTRHAPVDTFKMGFECCTLETSSLVKRIKPGHHLYEGGCVQILYRYNEEEYQTRTTEPGQTEESFVGGSGNGLGRRALLNTKLSRYRLAVYGRKVGSNGPSQPTCIVLNIDRDGCFPDIKSGKDKNTVTFKSKALIGTSFLVTIFQCPQDLESHAERSPFPGYPLSPEVLDIATSREGTRQDAGMMTDGASNDWITTKVKSVTLQLDSAKEFEIFATIIEKYKINTKRTLS